MPAPILTAAATVMCPHGGQAKFVPSNPQMTIAGSPVILATDVTTIVGCPFNISGAPAPCLTIQWTNPAVQTSVMGIPVVLQTSVGLCMGGSPGVPAIIVNPGQVLVTGT